MRAAHIRTALVLISVVAVIGGIVILRQSSRLSAYERQHDRDVRALEQMRATLRPQQPQNPAVPAPHSESAVAPAHHDSGTPDTSAIAARDADIERLNRELEGARADIARLEAELRGSVQNQPKVVAEADQTQKRERDWQDRLDAIQQQLESARAAAQASRERAASVEADNARIRSENDAGTTRANELRKAMASFQDLDRRRDTYLNSIIRRYRDITEQFRAMAGVLQSGHGSEPSSFSGLAVSRIQNAISLAEDDLRRLNELNAQAHQLQSKLVKN